MSESRTLNAGTRLAGFAVVLTGALGAGALLGGAVGPVDVSEATGGMGGMEGMEGMGGDAATVSGLSAVDQGYAFVPTATTLRPDQPFTFTIEGPDGDPVTDYEVELDKELHLLVVSTDLVTYQHVHPERDEQGTWSVVLDDLDPGSYRAVADVVPADGPALALGVNLSAPGEFDPTPLPEPAAVDQVDGYEVRLEGDLRSGSSPVRLIVERDGEAVDDLEPYLGASGHLVAFRADDLAYAHVHPEETTPEGAGEGAPASARGPTVPFIAELPSAGTYRLFFDFAHEGEVRTAAFTVEVAAGDGADDHADDTTTEEDH